MPPGETSLPVKTEAGEEWKPPVVSRVQSAPFKVYRRRGYRRRTSLPGVAQTDSVLAVPQVHRGSPAEPGVQDPVSSSWSEGSVASHDTASLISREEEEESQAGGALAPTWSDSGFDVVEESEDEFDGMERGSGRPEKFSGRPGTMALKEFKAFFRSVMAELRFKYADIYTEHYAFEHMQRYLAEEALASHEKHFDELMATSVQENPAYLHAINQAHALALREAQEAYEGPEQGRPTRINLTGEQLLAAVRGVEHMIEREVIPNPVVVFFEMLEREFPAKNAEKVQELMDFKRQKGETLKMMYRRLDDLRQDLSSALMLRLLSSFENFGAAEIPAFSSLEQSFPLAWGQIYLAECL